MLCLPISNADVERTFSQTALTKTWNRSAMRDDFLEAIMYCKFGIKLMGLKKTAEFHPPNSIWNFESEIYDL